MRTLYQASNGIEAHMLLNLLEQEGLTGRVDGEYLQGGVGELPAAGLVKVMVLEKDYAAAKVLVDKWDAAQPAQSAQVSTPAPSRQRSRSGIFVLGLVLGIAGSYFYYRTPIEADGIDFNHDGILDTRWNYAPSGRQTHTEIDRNLDGKVDIVYTFGRNGATELAESDDNFDGIFETRTTYQLDNPAQSEIDSDGDGYRDLRLNHVNGVHVSTEYIYPATGMPQKIEYFGRGKIAYAEIDTDKDGTMDVRITYDALSEVESELPLGK